MREGNGQRYRWPFSSGKARWEGLPRTGDPQSLRPPETEDMGISEGLRHSLESYLERSAAELDERGAELNARAEELDSQAENLEREAARIKDLEADLAERERRLGELRSTQENAEETLSRVHATLDDR